FNYRKVQALRLSSGLHYDINRASTGFITAYYRYNNVEQNPTYRIKKTNDPLQARGEINKNQFNSLGLLAQHAQQWNHDQLQAIFGIQVEYSPLQYHAQYILIQKDNAGYYVSYTPTDSVLTDYAANIYNYAAYTQWKWQPVEKLYLTAGLRYDRIDYDFTNHLLPSAYTGAPSGRNGFSHLTPKIGFTYVLSSHMGGYANFSQGFAPPDITDLYNGVKVPYLKPASYLNYETGIWLRIDDDRMLWQVDVYRMLGKNEIISVRQDDGSYQNANAGKTLHEGLEYTFQYHPLQTLQIRWNGTWAYHAFIQYQINGKDYAHHRMNAAPGWIYDAAVQYQMPFLKGLQLSAEWQHVGRYYIDPANTLTYPGYDLFHIRTAYEQKRWAVWLHLLNVFNTIYATTVDYASYGNTYRAGIPRTWQIGFSYNLIQPDQSFKK
ncbi:MAG: TonB-dependent receptor, partial [Thermoflavifilum sp.]|nr:TonB-dependent receptor [Thermoflavifilum sp.]